MSLRSSIADILVFTASGMFKQKVRKQPHAQYKSLKNFAPNEAPRNTKSRLRSVGGLRLDRLDRDARHLPQRLAISA